MVTLIDCKSLILFFINNTNTSSLSCTLLFFIVDVGRMREHIMSTLCVQISLEGQTDIIIVIEGVVKERKLTVGLSV